MSKTLSRREFLKTSALTGAAVSVAGLASSLPAWARTAEANSGKLRVLVLGGTGQTGPHLIRQLLDAGHTVTMFNRGNRSEELFPDVECLIGDRALDAEDGRTALESAIAAGRRWDICIDIWPHIPKIVENTGVLLRGNVGHFMYVSSMSVYADTEKPNADHAPDMPSNPAAGEVLLKGHDRAEAQHPADTAGADNEH